MVRGYHIYRDIWTAVVNEELRCSACSSCVNFAYLPLFADCFDAAAVAASFASRMIVGSVSPTVALWYREESPTIFANSGKKSSC